MTRPCSEQVEQALDRLGPLAGRDVPLAPLCTYKVGGAAAGLVEVINSDVLEAVRLAIEGIDVPVLVVGRGSNLLVADRGFCGIALHLGESFEAVEIDAHTGDVVAGGAALLPVVARKTAAAGLTGFEWAVGVPGSVGGAVRMNAGGHGSDMAASLESATIFDLDVGGPAEVPASDLQLEYRSSNVKSTALVLNAKLKLMVGDRATSEVEISEIVKWRRANQPGGQNAGSVFANPDGESAGRLIESAGLKGMRIGSAVVSEKHANFIQADPGGSADDVYALIREVTRRIREHTGVVLRAENLLIGFDEDQNAS